MKNYIVISLRMAAILAVITCGLYPLAVFAIAQIAFHDKANGSFREFRGRVVGSELIGQNFASDRFFHSRPSAAGSAGYDATSSGGTNLGPTSKKLLDAIAARVKAFDVRSNVPADAVTSSASGLDPHISPQNAYAQAARVARANGMSKAAVEAMIRERTEGRFLGLYGEPRVNVLALNVELVQRRRDSGAR